MELEIPEAEIIDLISSLEGDSCPMPRGESSGLSSLRPREAYAACAKGIACRKKGDLVGANEAFVEMFHLMETVNTTAFLAWAKTLLLAKDFRQAQLLMHVQFANDNRGAEQFNPFIWMNLNLNLPELDVRYLFDGSSPGYEVNAVSYFDDPQQLVARIAHFGGNDEFWGSNYWWTPDDYADFVSYFSPLAILAAEDEQYMWTIDDPEETVSYYNEIYDRLITESR